MKLLPLLLAPSLLVALACCSTTKTSGPDAYFAEHVKPVLESHCLRCHAGAKPPAGLNLTNGTAALASRTRKGKAFIVPGKPDDSLMMQAISRNGTHPKMMPRLTISLTDDQIGALREWIEDGAYWPSGPAGQLHHTPNAENP